LVVHGDLKYVINASKLVETNDALVDTVVVPEVQRGELPLEMGSALLL